MFGRRHFTNVLQSLCIRGPTSASLGISLLCSLMNQICFLLPFPLSRTVFVASCLDYCNALLYGVAKTEIQRLQTVMNAAARLGLGRYDHVTPVLRDTLHWLPVWQRVVFKLAVLAFDCVRGTCPSSLTSEASALLLLRSTQADGHPLSSTWPHLNSDVGLEKGEY